MTYLGDERVHAVPGQLKGNAAKTAEMNQRIFRLKLGGATNQQIADVVGLAKSTVHGRLSAVLLEMTWPEKQELRALASARLDDLRLKGHAAYRDAGQDVDLRLKALDRLLRIEERDARLHGVDAELTTTVQLDQRVELESTTVAEAVIAATLAVVAALPDIDGGFAVRLRTYALEAAQHKLLASAGEDPGPAPEVPRPYKMLTAGSPERPSDGPGDPGPHDGPAEPSGDAADAVLAELAAVQAEFPSLDWS